MKYEIEPMKEAKNKGTPELCSCGKKARLLTFTTFTDEVFFKVVCNCGNSSCSYRDPAEALSEWKRSVTRKPKQ